MKKMILFLAFFILYFFGQAKAERTPILVDTDMGLDDVRALALLIGSDLVEVTDLVTSDGSSSPQAGVENVRRILQFLERPTIPIGIGRVLNAPPWREKSDTLGWTQWPQSIRQPAPVPSSKDTILRALTIAPRPLTYVCIGPLTNLAEALLDPNFPLMKVERVLYYGSSLDEQEFSWNTMRDKEAAQRVFSSPLQVWIFNPSVDQLLSFDSALYSEISHLETKPAKLITLVHRDARVQNQFGTRHSMVWDEMLALFLCKPTLVKGEFHKTGNPFFSFKEWNRIDARNLYLEILSGKERRY